MIQSHSHLPSDNDFDVDEREKTKHEEVLVPEEWYNISEKAKTNGQPFRIHQIDRLFTV